MVLGGNLNVAPTIADVFDETAFDGYVQVTEPEHAALQRLRALDLHDLIRERWPDERAFSYWDYRAGMFHKNLGVR